MRSPINLGSRSVRSNEIDIVNASVLGTRGVYVKASAPVASYVRRQWLANERTSHEPGTENENLLHLTTSCVTNGVVWARNRTGRLAGTACVAR